MNDLEQNIPINALYGLNTEHQESDLKSWYDEYQDDLLANCIIIGDDPGGGMIVLSNDPEVSGVFYWDHAHYF